MSASQCDRVYDVLKDGRPHSIQEIHERAGFMRLNSRIAELRSSRGLTIIHWTQKVRDAEGRPRPPLHFYRLVLDEEGATPPLPRNDGTAPSSSSDQGRVGDQAESSSAASALPQGGVLGELERAPSLDCNDDEQLALIDVTPSRPREIYA